jgi:serine carboxypeptidase-like clade 2
VLNYTVNPEGSYYIYPILIKAGLKVMVYSGDADAIVPITGTVAWIKEIFEEMRLPFKKPWRPWVSGSQNISGMIWELEGISLVTFLGAGHMVPTTKPEEAHTMLDNYLNGVEFKWPNDYMITR